MIYVLALLNYLDLLEKEYRIVASTIPSRLEAHAGFFRLPMKGIFDPEYCDLFSKVDFLISNVH